MIQNIANFFDRLMRKYTPDPFILALFLTALTFLGGVFGTDQSVKQMSLFWGDGFWKLTSFTLQMVMVFIGGYIVAAAPMVHSLLIRIAKIAKTPGQAVILITVASTLTCWINWGLGLVIGGFLCRALLEAVPKANFRLLVASAYSGFLVWHGGLSGTIPLTIATPGNFTETMMGGLVPISQTIFTPFNITACLSLLIALPIVNWFVGTKETNITKVEIESMATKDLKRYEDAGPSERLEHSRTISIVAGSFGLMYLFYQYMDDKFALDITRLNFIFLFVGILLHQSPRSLMNAVEDGAKRVGPMLLQFPFYGGIMGMIQYSGLADVISEWFISISTKDTFALWTFYSSAVLNLFVPSGGGHWAVQSPIVIQSAKALGADLPMAAMAVAWGDAWTNMIQPFWALPLLAIAGLKLRDIMGYCVIALITSGILLSFWFLVF